MNEPIVRLRAVAKQFVMHQRNGIAIPVLRNLNLDVWPGECLALSGASGSGKSTVLKLIHGNYRASAGSIRVSDLEVSSATPRALVAMREHTVGYVSQFLRAIPRVPALQVVAQESGDDAGQAQTTAGELLTRLRIPEPLWHLPPATFSGGEQQRINIARGFARQRPVLLLDEPTASLDPDNVDTVIAMIGQARSQGKAVVGIFHDPRVRSAVASRVIDIREFQ